jgi:hypothetical protein
MFLALYVMWMCYQITFTCVFANNLYFKNIYSEKQLTLQRDINIEHFQICGRISLLKKSIWVIDNWVVFLYSKSDLIGEIQNKIRLSLYSRLKSNPLKAQLNGFKWRQNKIEWTSKPTSTGRLILQMNETTVYELKFVISRISSIIGWKLMI